MFVYGVRKCSTLIVLCIAVQFWPMPRLSFLHCLFLSHLLLLYCPEGTWVYFWAVCSFPLIYISVFVPAPCRLLFSLQPYVFLWEHLIIDI